jgi:hypothetical protein
MACLSAIKAYRAGGGFRLVAHLTRLLTPTLPGEWLTAFGAAAVGLAAGLAAAATLVARRGLAPGPE